MSKKIFTLIVTNNRSSLNILKYIKANIKVINDMAVRISIKKVYKKDIDEAMYKRLSKQKIKKLPALIIDPKNHINKIGLSKIKGLFERNIRDFKSFSGGSVAGGGTMRSDIGLNPDMASYYYDELYGTDGKPRQDPDEGTSVKDDIDRKMRDYKPPSHRSQGGGFSTGDLGRDDPQPSQYTQDTSNYYEDNVMSSFEQVSTGDTDDQMVGNWMQNNVGVAYDPFG